MPSGNIFDTSLRATAELFAPYLAGSFGGLAIAVATCWPNQTVRNALESSLAALGYGNDCLAYVSLTGEGSAASDFADDDAAAFASSKALSEDFATRSPNPDAHQNGAPAASVETNNKKIAEEELPSLDAHALFTLIEGRDPKCIIALDAAAARTLAEAFHVKHILNAHGRFSGRDVVAFSDFASLMNSPEEKQRAWHLLKKLPKLN